MDYENKEEEEKTEIKRRVHVNNYLTQDMLQNHTKKTEEDETREEENEE